MWFGKSTGIGIKMSSNGNGNQYTRMGGMGMTSDLNEKTSTYGNTRLHQPWLLMMMMLVVHAYTYCFLTSCSIGKFHQVLEWSFFGSSVLAKVTCNELCVCYYHYMHVLKFCDCWRHVKFLRTSQTCKKWNVQWLCVAMSMVSFMTLWNCLRLAASHRTQTTCLWEIMWIVDTTVWRLSRCSFLLRCVFVLRTFMCCYLNFEQLFVCFRGVLHKFMFVLSALCTKTELLNICWF